MNTDRFYLGRTCFQQHLTNDFQLDSIVIRKFVTYLLTGLAICSQLSVCSINFNIKMVYEFLHEISFGFIRYISIHLALLCIGFANCYPCNHFSKENNNTQSCNSLSAPTQNLLAAAATKKKHEYLPFVIRCERYL